MNGAAAMAAAALNMSRRDIPSPRASSRLSRFMIRPPALSAGSIDLHAASELVVLVADELDELVVGRDLLIHANGKWFRVGLRVVDCDVDFQLAVCGTADTLDEPGLVRVRAAAHVEPSVVGARLRSPQIVGFDHERVAFPASRRVAVPEWLHTAPRGQRASVDVDVAKAVVRLVHDRDQAGVLHDLAKLAVRME